MFAMQYGFTIQRKIKFTPVYRWIVRAKNSYAGAPGAVSFGKMLMRNIEAFA